MTELSFWGKWNKYFTYNFISALVGIGYLTLNLSQPHHLDTSFVLLISFFLSAFIRGFFK